MKFDSLEQAYWDAQIKRVGEVRDRIANRAKTPFGKVVPQDDDLSIGEGRRLELTVMFLDISGFSQRPSSTPDEQEMMLRVLNFFMTETIKIVEDYGGCVEKNTGDGLMAYFEESAEVNSTQKAVACSLTLMAANDYLLAPVIRATPGVLPIRFRISMDYGFVTVARIGAPQRFNANVAIGNTANFASDMLNHVKADEIGLGEKAFNRLPTYWRSTWAHASPVSTGWTYSLTQSPYPLYIYTGRWAKTT